MRETSLPDWFMKRSLPLALLLYLVLYVLWLARGRMASPEREWVGGAAIVAAAFLAGGLAFYLNRRLADRRARRAWLWLALGLLVWVLADLARLFSAVWDWNEPAAGQAYNALYLLGALPLWFGLVLYPRKPRANAGALAMLIDATIIAATSVSLIWILMVQPFLLHPPNIRLPFASLFPFVDMAGILLVLILFLFSNADHMSLAFGWISLGLCASMASNLAYAGLIFPGLARGGGLADLGWVAGDVLFAAAAWADLNPAWSEKLNRQAWVSRWRGLFQSILPLLSMFLMGGYTLLLWTFNGRVNDLGLYITVVSGMGLAVRQGIYAGEVEMQKFANLVNSIAEPAFVCDQHGRLRLVNPALIEAAGAPSAAELLGRPLAAFLRPAEGMAAAVEQGLQTGWSGELMLLQPEERSIPIYLTLRPLKPGQALAGTAHDLSEQKARQAELQQANEQIAQDRAALARLNENLEQAVDEKTKDLTLAYRQLEEQNRALQELDRLKSDFVSMVSHELRAPLTNINSGIELSLMANGGLPGNTQRNLELVQAEIQRLANFIETILDLSALDAGRLPLYPAPLSLERVVEVLRQQMTHLEGAQRVVWKLPDPVPDFIADDRALVSILFHLLDNALKYAPEGEITVSAGQDADGARGWVEVADRGPGFSEEDRQHLFDRFYRTHRGDAQTVYGHGLGLYIVRRLLEAMEGEIRVQNRPGGGASILFYLPLLTDQGDGHESESSCSG
ncbi:MAG: PAS domain-containing protein [Chloroflexi bacterium]|nr:PAS domain-containing protein [Chloroflexota bacterium]